MKRHTTRNGIVVIELEDGDLPPHAYTHRLPVGVRCREPNKGRFWIQINAVAVEVLGRHGRLLSPNKQAYIAEHPGHEVLFNACVFSAGGTEIWFGDLDLERDSELLATLARRVGTIYVTPELPYRFQGLPRKRSRRRRNEIRRFPRFEADGQTGRRGGRQ